MNLKKIKLISILGIFVISFLTHFIYNIFPNIITSIIFPVNESIWEHMKILFTSQIIYSIIDYFLIKHNNIQISNFKSNVFITSFLSIPIYLIIYLPIRIIFGENLIVSILLMIIVFIISQIISYKILTSKENKLLNKYSLILIIICYIIFGILTYYPPQNFIFYDTSQKIYGIKKKID